jgi:squalene-hopene/tetraprenyl-beta-curcumene cyclase
MPFDRAAFDETLTNARKRLLAARNALGHWEGDLSSSALSTATAVFALHQVVAAFKGDARDRDLVIQAGRLIREGLAWLALHQNADGGWGDTTRSFSNISTTALCWAAFVADENWAAGAYETTLRAVEQWLVRQAGSLAPEVLASAIADRYGEDRTFSVPILTMMALAGRLGPGPEAWDLVPALPFELAAFPQRWFKWLKLPVVSYALPALIAIGQVRHVLRPSRRSAARFVRTLARGRTLRLLGRIQPTSGGFLEATPLTSFVVMSLAAAGRADHAVVRRGVEFLVRSVRPDGSWPIDTNLATWVTTLSINALAHNPDFHQVVSASERSKLREWLVSQQYRTEHPYTLADPGGWAWTDLPGGVPDADDTPGALLALRHLGDIDDRTRAAAASGVRWLLGLQNADGGMPTFCRGWGKLPFDRSSPDLTAHALRAWQAWVDDLPPSLARRVHAGIKRAQGYLAAVQAPDGHWSPLWFGNQHRKEEDNPTYGTSRVLRAAGNPEAGLGVLSRAIGWLLEAQNPDGGWGGGPGTPSTIEETALAVEALATNGGTGIFVCLFGGTGIPACGGTDILVCRRVGERDGIPAVSEPTRETSGIPAEPETSKNACPASQAMQQNQDRQECLSHHREECLRHQNGVPGRLDGQAGMPVPPPILSESDGSETFAAQLSTNVSEGIASAISRGVSWLIQHTDRGRNFEPSPIGFYFAKLWYWEQLYPLIWTVGALEQVAVLGQQRLAEVGDKPDALQCETVAPGEPN